MDYGRALEVLKAGKLVTRKGWNGKGMFIFMRPGDTLPLNTLLNAKSIPDSVKNYFYKKDVTNPVMNQQVTFTPYLCMKAADDTIVNGWLASQTDMLAEDWEEFRI